MTKFKEKEAKKELENGYDTAEEILKDDKRMDRFLQRLEKKLKVIPVAGKTLSMIPTLIELIRSYIKKEYKDIPIGSIIAIISALLYWLTPIDAIPDTLPGIGYVDDVSVLALCLKLVKSDIDDYEKWIKKNKKIIED
jgi:uncharacterized membrane protein YkvA (DUF1232 family)